MRQAFSDKRGITLVELLVVISIVSVLALALAFSYEGWTGRYKVEDSVKQLYTDMVYAKNRAIESSRDYFINFPTATAQSTSYTVYEDTNPAPAGDGLLDASQDAVVAGYPKTLDYPLSGYHVGIVYHSGGTPPTITTSSAIAIDTLTITFDKNGGITCTNLFPGGTDRGVIKFTDPDNPDPNIKPDYDCILISETSINIGQWDETNKICSIK